jgi:hypothetical protein
MNVGRVGSDASGPGMTLEQFFNNDGTTFIGRASTDVYNSLRGRIDPGIFQGEGGYTDPEPVGKICKLKFGFQFADGRESMSEWLFGLESLGPPPEVCDFVIAIVEATEPWYEQQKSMVKGG